MNYDIPDVSHQEVKHRCTSLTLSLLPWQCQLRVGYSHDNRLCGGRRGHAHVWWIVTEVSDWYLQYVAQTIEPAVKWILIHKLLPWEAVLMSLGMLGLPSPAHPYAPTLTLYLVFTFSLLTSTSWKGVVESEIPAHMEKSAKHVNRLEAEKMTKKGNNTTS